MVSYSSTPSVRRLVWSAPMSWIISDHHRAYGRSHPVRFNGQKLCICGERLGPRSGSSTRSSMGVLDDLQLQLFHMQGKTATAFGERISCRIKTSPRGLTKVTSRERTGSISMQGLGAIQRSGPFWKVIPQQPFDFGQSVKSGLLIRLSICLNGLTSRQMIHSLRQAAVSWPRE